MLIVQQIAVDSKKYYLETMYPSMCRKMIEMGKDIGQDIFGTYATLQVLYKQECMKEDRSLASAFLHLMVECEDATSSGDHEQMECMLNEYKDYQLTIEIQ